MSEGVAEKDGQQASEGKDLKIAGVTTLGQNMSTARGICKSEEQSFSSARGGNIQSYALLRTQAQQCCIYCSECNNIPST